MLYTLHSQFNISTLIYSLIDNLVNRYKKGLTIFVNNGNAQRHFRRISVWRLGNLSKITFH